MKKLFVMMVLGMFLVQSIVAQKRTISDRESYLLKGLVKTVLVERAEIKPRDGQATEGRRQLQSITTYDEKGNMLEVIRYNYNGSVLAKTVFTHDGVRKQSEIAFKADGTVFFESVRQIPTREYDTHENWTKQIAPTTVSQSGITKESTEVIYRTVTYY